MTFKINYNKLKLIIVIIYGGISLENNISIVSALNIIKNIDFNKFFIFIIGIDNKGSFHIEKILENNIINYSINYLNKILNKKNNILKIKFNKKVLLYSRYIKCFTPDVFFPLTHGYLGEDGNMQGFLNLLKIPYIGSSLKSSFICMNKDITKNILEINKLPIIPYIKINKNNLLKISYKKIKNKIGKIFFIKSSNQGSSIGITLVKSKKDFSNGISRAFYFSKNIIFEPLITGKEIECSVLYNFGKLEVSECAEIIKKNNFYSFNQKYNNKNKSKIIIPAKINNKLNINIKKYSLKIFKLLECKGIARIDFIVNKNKIFINEINTIPGFTENSACQKLWENKKIKLKKLISILIYSEI